VVVHITDVVMSNGCENDRHNSENDLKYQETSGKSGLTLLRATLVGGDGLCNFNHGMLWSMLLRTDGNGALSRPPQREEERERIKERRLTKREKKFVTGQP